MLKRCIQYTFNTSDYTLSAELVSSPYSKVNTACFKQDDEFIDYSYAHNPNIVLLAYINDNNGDGWNNQLSLDDSLDDWLGDSFGIDFEE